MSGPLAHLEAPELVGSVDLSAPYAGLDELSVFGNRITGAVLGLQLDTRDSWRDSILQDAYHRGNDLVAVYEQTAQRPYRATVYWRVLDLAARAAVAVELIVSVQTNVLDTSPQLRARSRVAAAEALGLSGCGNWVRLAADSVEVQATGAAANERLVVLPLRPVDATYCEMIHPSDWRGMELKRKETEMEIDWMLVGHFMEKGVVRRLRVRGVFMRGRPDERLIRELSAEFAASPPPLTT